MEITKISNFQSNQIVAAGIGSFFQCTLFYWCEIGKNRLQAGKKVNLQILIGYKGYSIALCYIVLSRCIGFGIFEGMKSKQNKSVQFKNSSNSMMNLVSALITGLIKPIILFPIETIKIQMQVNSISIKEAYKGMNSLTLRMKLQSLVYLQLKNFFAYFTWFEVRSKLNDYVKRKESQRSMLNRINKNSKNFVIGSIASLSAFILSSPFSTLKTLRQVGIEDTVKKLYNTGGSLRFHHGVFFHFCNLVGGGGVFNSVYSKLTNDK